MSDTKLNRATLRRQAQRVESYASLASLSKRKAILEQHSMVFKKSRTETLAQKSEISKPSYKEEDEDTSKDLNHFSSPTSSVKSSSSDSSQDFKQDIISRIKENKSSSYQSELELTSVMTRSATRKCASMGAFHNRVNFEEELKILKKWPANISYPTPTLPNDHILLKDVVTRSLNEVMAFCKNATITENGELAKAQDETDSLELGEEFANFIDLSPYLTQEPVVINGNDETQITFHLNDNFVPNQFINIISLGEEDQNGTLFIQEENEDYETITLHSEETYLLDNKYFSNMNCTSFKPLNFNIDSQNVFQGDPMLAVHNDHTYALRYTENKSLGDQKQYQTKSFNRDEQARFKLENALNDLLLNTAILKCLICRETPQEMISFLDRSHKYFK